MQLPLAHAFELGLPLEGTTSVTLADGSMDARLTAQAQATFVEESVVGIVIIEFDSPEILIGMDFLRRFRRGLVVSRHGVRLIPELDQTEQDHPERVELEQAAPEQD